MQQQVTRKTESKVDQPSPQSITSQRHLVDELDEILDEIDAVLEEDAETFLREYRQQGGQ